MKQVGQMRITKNGAGSVKLIPQDAEDMWHVYNLISRGDHLASTTIRKVQSWNTSARVTLTLEVRVENTDYDRAASSLRIRGKVVSENDHVKVGAYHTLELEPKRAFVLTKDSWDAMAVQCILRACTDSTANPDLAVVLLQEGLAHVCHVGASSTITKAKVETPMPRKHGGAAHKFLENVLQAVLWHVDVHVIKCLVIASPGCTKDQFFKYMMAEAVRRKLNLHREKIVLAHASSGYQHS